MDLLSISKRLSGLQSRMDAPMPMAGSSPGAADRLKDTIKQVTTKRAIKNKWGGTNYPIDVSEYGQFLSSLQMLSWTFRDMGYDLKFLTRSGLSYDHVQYLNHGNVFRSGGGQVVALVAIGPKCCFRISRDGKTLRYRSFDDMGRALAPMRDGDTNGTRPLSATLAKELVRQMKYQCILDPKDEDSLRRWGRMINGLKPASATTLKNRIKIEFRKVR